MEELQEKLKRLCSAGEVSFDQILLNMSETYHKKNHDYGNSFEKSCNEFGLTAPIIRMSDKLERIKTLNKISPLIGDERIEDTLLDLANYAVMTLLWVKSQ
jgi:hypothetical protein